VGAARPSLPAGAAGTVQIFNRLPEAWPLVLQQGRPLPTTPLGMAPDLLRRDANDTSWRWRRDRRGSRPSCSRWSRGRSHVRYRYRFLNENPGTLGQMKQRCRTSCSKMLRGANAVGYTSYPNVVTLSTRRGSGRGRLPHRLLEYSDSMKVSWIACGRPKVAELAICYTERSPSEATKYSLD